MRRHPLDGVSLVFGLIFLSLSLLFLSGADVWELTSRFWPIALVVLGLAVLFTARRTEEAATSADRPDQSLDG